MKTKGKKFLALGIILIFIFAVWTVLITTVDVQPVGINDTDIGFATLNCWFHRLTGINMMLYDITDWLGLVPLFVCFFFGFIGLCQMIKRKSLFKVDCDILILGLYYVTVILCYFVFEALPINYRPVLINNNMEGSYPSSTMLLVLSVMPTLGFQLKRRIKNNKIKAINVMIILFSVFMVTGRLISGVHWLTDIIGSCIFSAGLYMIYRGVVLLTDRRFLYGV
ncbi:MAG: phosphatase PAP2 family protein [Acutalibacteraceae bacterium]|nr:phosphatase PAP2 family protein [Acutalibacteraceae bacterium]